MDFRRARKKVQALNRLALISCVAFALWLALASFTDWLSLGHTEASHLGQNRAATEWSSNLGVDSQTVRETTRGKAVFRTLRALPAPVVDDRGRYRLTGTSERDGVRRAYIKDEKLKKTFTLYEGDILGGRYEILAIHKDSVELRRGNEVTALRK